MKKNASKTYRVTLRNRISRALSEIVVHYCVEPLHAIATVDRMGYMKEAEVESVELV